ncbi:MAG TPA: DUF2207 domain-containing protein [Chloroflexota bacterium]|nr:DUF2207 domain-containing protein [Chloroflexota bacterium]
MSGRAASLAARWSRAAWRPCLALLVFLALGLPAPPAAAQSGVAAEQYLVDLAVQPDGALAVTEQQTFFLGGGPYRRGETSIETARVEAIRDLVVGEPGRDYRQVSTPTEEPYTFHVQQDGQRLRVTWWFPPTQDARRTFDIRYRAEGAVRIYPGGDQVYWPAIEPDRRFPVREARVRVRLPAEVAPDALRAAAYPERLNARYTMLDARTVEFVATDLPPGEPLVIRVQFPHGLVNAQPPAWQAAADREDWLQQNLRPALDFLMLVAALLILAVGLTWLALRWSASRAPTVGAVPPLLREPPDDTPAPLVGVLLDQRADNQDIVATLFDLARRGAVRITPVAGPAGPSDYLLERLPTEPEALRDYERHVLLAVFGEATQVRMSEVWRTFAGTWPTLKRALYQEAVRAGLFADDPELVRRRYQAWGVTLGALAILGWLVGASLLGHYSGLAWLPPLALLLVGLALLVAAPHLPRRTRVGALAARRWEAFRRYLAATAAGREQAPPELFERYLPYAIVFGLDRSWVERFASTAAPAPSWYGIDPGPVIIWGGPPWIGPMGGPGRPADSGPAAGPVPGTSPSAEPAGSYGGPGGLGGLSDSLADLLSRASDVFAHGGGSDWSGGGAGDYGGWSGSIGGGWGDSGGSGFDGGSSGGGGGC